MQELTILYFSRIPQLDEAYCVRRNKVIDGYHYKKGIVHGRVSRLSDAYYRKIRARYVRVITINRRVVERLFELNRYSNESKRKIRQIEKPD